MQLEIQNNHTFRCTLRSPGSWTRGRTAWPQPVPQYLFHTWWNTWEFLIKPFILRKTWTLSDWNGGYGFSSMLLFRKDLPSTGSHMADSSLLDPPAESIWRARLPGLRFPKLWHAHWLSIWCLTLWTLCMVLSWAEADLSWPSLVLRFTASASLIMTQLA